MRNKKTTTYYYWCNMFCREGIKPEGYRRIIFFCLFFNAQNAREH